MTARPEGEWDGGAQCDIKYLIPNNKLTKYSVRVSKEGGGDGTMVEKCQIPNIAL